MTNKCVFLESRKGFYSKLITLSALRTQTNWYSENPEHLILDINEMKKTF